MKLFKPSAFDKQNEVIKFKAIVSNQLNPTNGCTKKNKKIKSEKTKNNLTNSNDEKSGNSPKKSKLMNGRIEKSKNTKKHQPQQLKIKPIIKHVIKETIKEAKANKTIATKPAQQINEFEAKLQTQLMGGRFRYINEQLYTMNSSKAEQLFKDDPTAFTAYHEGYRHQLKKWPLNPLERIIKLIKRLPKSLEIGDFGCGEGILAKLIPNKVYSLDLVSLRPDIIACDMANTPLKTHSLDVAVYCLSLMGTNLKEYIMESNRVLKLNGLLLIAEIQARFDNVKQFTRQLDSYGFHLIKQDAVKDVFYVFQFKKNRNVGKVAIVPELTLKPCLYKKR